MKVNIEQLEQATLTIFAHLRELGISEVDIHNDYYWQIDYLDRYDPTKEPKNFSLGQLSDDVKWLENYGSHTKSHPISYAFVWLSSVLLAVGEKIVR